MNLHSPKIHYMFGVLSFLLIWPVGFIAGVYMLPFVVVLILTSLGFLSTATVMAFMQKRNRTISLSLLVADVLFVLFMFALVSLNARI